MDFEHCSLGDFFCFFFWGKDVSLRPAHPGVITEGKSGARVSLNMLELIYLGLQLMSDTSGEVLIDSFKQYNLFPP